jgi:hypothetical protein
MKYLLAFLIFSRPLAAQTLTVIQEKSLWRDGKGIIEITNDGIEYRADKAKNSRDWKYQDIQYFDRISRKEFTILSYEDNPLLLGRDKQYRFRIIEGEMTETLFEKIRDRINKPATNRAFPALQNVRYALPVKHLHALGGCEGTLEFTDDAIYYVTKNKKDARAWRLAVDVQSVWSSDPYQLEIHIYENNRREFSRTRVYRFELKQSLNPDWYRSLKLKLYQLVAVHRSVP